MQVPNIYVPQNLVHCRHRLKSITGYDKNSIQEITFKNADISHYYNMKRNDSLKIYKVNYERRLSRLSFLPRVHNSKVKCNDIRLQEHS